MSQQPATSAPDPFALWRDWLSQSERQWNQFLNQAMATDEFSQAMGQMMDLSLGMQKSLNDVMGRYFTALNLPTRTDVLSLGNRLSEVEERLGNLERMLARALPTPPASESGPGSAVKRPPRTRKPASRS